MNLELHKRITRDQDLFFVLKAHNTRFKKMLKRFKQVRAKEEFNRKIDEKVAQGMSPMQAAFHVSYNEPVSLIGKENRLINKVKKSDDWSGGNISFPLI